MDAKYKLGTLLFISVFLISNVPLAFAGQWVAVGTAPGAVGTYNVVVRATYTDQGVVGLHPLTLWVRSLAETPEDLSVQPLFQQDITPPIALRFNITVNRTPIDELADSNVTVEFHAPSGGIIYTRAPPLEASDIDGIYTAVADVPFEGDYNAVIGVKTVHDDVIYEGMFRTEFYADSPSENLDMNSFIRETLYPPGTGILVYANMSFYGQELGGANIFRTRIFEDQTALIWDDQAHIYWGTLTAPEDEGKYDLAVFAVRQGYLKVERIYVIDTTRLQARMCPITPTDFGCNNIEEVRRCYAEYLSAETFISEEQMAFCAETGMLKPPVELISCETRKGDLDGDINLDIDDVELLQTLLLDKPEDEREEFIDCADYNFDGEVDEDDLKCMTNVLAGKWAGTMNGGFCFDVKTTSPLAGDLDENRIIDGDDNTIIEKVIQALKNQRAWREKRLDAEDADQVEDVVVPEGIASAADFNQDDDITEFDQNCLKNFVGARLGEPETLVPIAQRGLSPSCMAIYGLDKCWDIRGDINGDLFIDETDEILVMMARRGLIKTDAGSGIGRGGSPGVARMGCVDVNEDGRVTQEDELCVKAYVSGDFDAYYTCIGCEEDLPREARFPVEICGDNYDNDCDGLIDRTSLDPDEDECECNKNTPCWRIKDGNGAEPGVDDGEVQLCRWITSPFVTQPGISPEQAEAVGYQWTDWQNAVCNKDRGCWSMVCYGQQYKCSSLGNDVGQWIPYCQLPGEDEYTYCEDGWDNDCVGGDKECYEEENQIISGIAGAAISYLGGPIVSLGASMVVQFALPEYAKGFMWGSLAGGLIGSAGLPYSYSTASDMTAKSSGELAKKVGESGKEGITSLADSGQVGGYSGGFKTNFLGAIRNPTAYLGSPELSGVSGINIDFGNLFTYSASGAGAVTVAPGFGAVIWNNVMTGTVFGANYLLGESHDWGAPDGGFPPQC